MANFRPLQPAPMDQDAPPPQARPILTQKPKRTVTLGACVACRKRKSKCDGNRPICTCCVQKDTNCIYELGPNEKPSQAMKRKNEEMQGELSNLRQVYDFLRLRPEHEAMDILKRIRSDDLTVSPTQRIQELADFVRHGDVPTQQSAMRPPPAPQNIEASHSITLPPLRMALDPSSNIASSSLPFPGILSLEADGPTSQRRRYASDADVSTRSDSQGSLPRPTSIEALLHPTTSNSSDDFMSDPRLASARNWTSVTEDTNLLVALLSAWTVREYSYYHYLDREAFLDDMAAGRNEYCSPLLVNALLASACFHSSAVKDRQKPFSETSTTTLFYKEAQRLWDLGEGKDSLPRLQAGICLYLVLGKHGRDKVGHTFLVEACRIGHNLKIFESPPATPNQQYSSPCQQLMNRVRAVTAWTLFNFQLSMSLVYSFPVILTTPPSVDIPYLDISTELLFRSECAKHALIVECVNLFSEYEGYRASNLVEPDRIEDAYRRLASWWSMRASEIDPDRVPSKENLLCAMMYHVYVVNLFQPIVNHDKGIDRIDAHRAYAQHVTNTALREMRRLLALQEARHGWMNAITLVLHPITVACAGSLDELAQDSKLSVPLESTEPYQGLLTCLRALGHLSSYNYYAQPLFRLLTQKCLNLGVQLPPDLGRMHDFYTSEEWTKNAVYLVSSQYIADIRKPDNDTVNERMDAIISTWEGMSLEDKKDSRG